MTAPINMGLIAVAFSMECEGRDGMENGVVVAIRGAVTSMDHRKIFEKRMTILSKLKGGNQLKPLASWVHCPRVNDYPTVPAPSPATCLSMYTSRIGPLCSVNSGLHR